MDFMAFFMRFIGFCAVITSVKGGFDPLPKNNLFRSVAKKKQF